MNQVISQVEVPMEKVVIDREKVCPMLLRIFLSEGRHNKTNDYGRGRLPPSTGKSQELQIYTWMDCTLRELMGLIKDVNQDCKTKGTEFRFAIIYPEDHYDRYDMREIGATVAGHRGKDDEKTLSHCNFEVGDFIDVAIIHPSNTHHRHSGSNNGMGGGGGGSGVLGRNNSSAATGYGGGSGGGGGWGNRGFGSGGGGGDNGGRGLPPARGYGGGRSGGGRDRYRD